MTRSYSLKKYPDADYCVADMGVVENHGATWDDFTDEEVRNYKERDITAPF